MNDQGGFVMLTPMGSREVPDKIWLHITQPFCMTIAETYAYGNPEGEKYTKIYTGNFWTEVRETPEEIVKLFKEAQSDE